MLAKSLCQGQLLADEHPTARRRKAASAFAVLRRDKCATGFFQPGSARRGTGSALNLWWIF